MTEWIKHDGLGIPVDGETRVALKFADNWTNEDHRTHLRASYWGELWVTEDFYTDDLIITHYKVVDK